MLPDDPVLRGRLFRAARVLLGWSQAGLACAAGVGTAVVYRIEAGCPGPGDRTVAALEAALEEAGVQFIGDGNAWAHGLRYTPRRVAGEAVASDARRYPRTIAPGARGLASDGPKNDSRAGVRAAARTRER
jgi:transcriptional regulator with XRE-family HTH domain